MSRTDKDVPYWVRCNREGIVRHDHRRLGRKIYRKKRVLDEDGNPVMETHRYSMTAERMLAEVRNDTFYGWFSFGDEAKRAALEAEQQGDLKRLIEYGTPWQSYKTEDVYIGETYCGGDDYKFTEGRDWHFDLSDCYPVIPAEAPWWSYGPSAARAAEHERFYGHDRGQQRAKLTELKKRVNAGDEVDNDWDEGYDWTHHGNTFIYW